MFAILWLITSGLLALLWRKRHHPLQEKKPEKLPGNVSGNIRKARKQFLAACQDNNPQQARRYLLKWAAIHWPESPPCGLDALALRLNDPAVHAALSNLNRKLYLDRDKSWDGRELAKLLSDLPQYSPSCVRNKNNTVLPNLYT